MPRKLRKTDCKICGEPFETREPNAKCCSLSCANKSRAVKNSNGPAKQVEPLDDMVQAQYQEYEAVIRTQKVQIKRLLQQSLFVDRAIEKIAKGIPVLPSVPVQADRKTGAYEHSGLLNITDNHFGLKYSLEESAGFGFYDCEEAAKRLKHIVTATHELTTGGSISVDEMNIFFGGDIIHGLIHKGPLREDDVQIVDQVVIGAWVYAQMFRDLARKYKKVNVICVPGNHGRVTDKPQSEGVSQNFDSLLYLTCKLLLQNQKNISFDISRMMWGWREIAGRGILMVHGDRGIKGVSTNATYPVNHSLYRAITNFEHILAQQGKKVDYVNVGHFHTYIQVPHKNGMITFNGSLPGVDPFSIDKGFFARPSCQVLQLFHKRHGLSATHLLTPTNHGYDKNPYPFERGTFDLSPV